MHIRTATLADSSLIAHLLTQLSYPQSALQVETQLKKLQQDPCNQVWVATDLNQQVYQMERKTLGFSPEI